AKTPPARNIGNVLKLIQTVIAFTGTFAALGQPASAADYPSRPVQLVVGLAAGGGTDVVARILGEWLSQNLGQQFVIENSTGMGGNLAVPGRAKGQARGEY